jgi:hypothetical protein
MVDGERDNHFEHGDNKLSRVVVSCIVLLQRALKFFLRISMAINIFVWVQNNAVLGRGSRVKLTRAFVTSSG